MLERGLRSKKAEMSIDWTMMIIVIVVLIIIGLVIVGFSNKGLNIQVGGLADLFKFKGG